MFKGVYTALITPFRYGEVDLDAFKKMVDWQIQSKVTGLVIGGSTGEGQSISEEELLKIIELAVSVSNGRVKIIANTGVISTIKSIELTKAAQELGVDGVMLIAPYYIRPTQEGLYQHFKTIHDLTQIPIILYNNPTRCGIDISNDTISKLSKLERIIALKDCSGDVSRCGKLRQKVDPDFEIVCGDDSLMLSLYSQGAVGLISTVANIVPALVVKLHHLWYNDRIKDAIELQDMFIPLNEALSCETNPIGYKYAASQFELCLPDVRLPLVQLSEPHKKLVRETLQALKTKLYESS
jgi:4-hydroxy-tetrahydrodipicolinate synthase